MSGYAWTLPETVCFLDWTDKMSTSELAAELGRSVPAVMSMRRKLKRLKELGARPGELAQLLLVNENLVLHRGLRKLRIRSQQSLVPVRHYLRRGRITGRPHLVDDHVRLPAEKP